MLIIHSAFAQPRPSDAARQWEINIRMENDCTDGDPNQASLAEY